jgi:DNA-binding phage protein
MNLIKLGDQELIRLRLAASLEKVLQASSLKYYRQLAQQAGIKSDNIQRLVTLKADIKFPTLIAILRALDISLSQFAAIHDGLTTAELDEYLGVLAARKREKLRNSPTSPSKASARKKK